VKYKSWEPHHNGRACGAAVRQDVFTELTDGAFRYVRPLVST
jgi:hypothetical protein